jgi:hypothetical protein
MHNQKLKMKNSKVVENSLNIYLEKKNLFWEEREQEGDEKTAELCMCVCVRGEGGGGGTKLTEQSRSL